MRAQIPTATDEGVVPVPHRFTRDLMLDAVPYSSPSIFAIAEICVFGGMINEIILVPALRGHQNSIYTKVDVLSQAIVLCDYRTRLSMAEKASQRSSE